MKATPCNPRVNSDKSSSNHLEKKATFKGFHISKKHSGHHTAEGFPFMLPHSPSRWFLSDACLHARLRVSPPRGLAQPPVSASLMGRRCC